MLFLPAAVSGAWMRCTPVPRGEASVCGYTGGDTPDPDYRSVCSGTTGHQEALKLSFDPQVIDLDTVLDIFLHEPRSDELGSSGCGYRFAVPFSAFLRG